VGYRFDIEEMKRREVKKREEKRREEKEYNLLD